MFQVCSAHCSIHRERTQTWRDCNLPPFLGRWIRCHRFQALQDFLEYDTARSGRFEPLKEVPVHKNVILGLITSKFPKLEDLEEMTKKMHQAAEFVTEGSGQTNEEAMDRLGVSPKGGFASHSDGNNVGKEDMVKKSQLVRKLAVAIWPGQS